LVDRPEFVGLAQTAEPPGANRAELEAAADALLAHSLAGRRTDDELLGAVLALWAEHEGSMVHGDERLVHRAARADSGDVGRGGGVEEALSPRLAALLRPAGRARLCDQSRAAVRPGEEESWH
jgi:hypothetical protein